MATVLGWGLAGLVVLAVLWPTAASGRRFLRRWGVPEPDDAQVARAVGYLRDRRLLYPVLFLLVPVAARALDVARDGSPALHHLAALLLALAVAEAAAALRPARGTRTATLTRRHWRDLVPAGALGALLALGGVAAALAAAGLAAQPWAARVAAAVPDGGVWRSPDGRVVATVSEQHYAQVHRPVSLLVLVGVAAGLVAVLGVVRLAVRRRSVPDPPVDLALRRRSARVAVGIGLAWMASMVLVANNRLAFLRAVDLPWAASPPVPPWLEHTSTAGFVGLVALLVGAVGWVLVANPPRRWSAA